MKRPTEGYKSDEGKVRWDLVDMDTIQDMAEILTFGADKYTDRNWEKGMNYGRLFGALLRHLTAWWMAKVRGKDGTDPETGKSHLAHAASCLHFLSSFERRGGYEQFDDRPVKD